MERTINKEEIRDDSINDLELKRKSRNSSRTNSQRIRNQYNVC